ncbi:MAG: hypothetical protein QF886_07735, partial [Planctomycetota bacterium]|nr:hypothetical protein [Planctomycetota bacterium]
MTSKERVLAAVQRKQVDRLPFYIMGFYGEESQRTIKDFFGTEDMEKIYDELGIDVRGVGGSWWKVPDRLDENGNKRELWGGGGPPYTEEVYTRPLRHAETVADI